MLISELAAQKIHVGYLSIDKTRINAISEPVTRLRISAFTEDYALRRVYVEEGNYAITGRAHNHYCFSKLSASICAFSCMMYSGLLGANNLAAPSIQYNNILIKFPKNVWFRRACCGTDGAVPGRYETHASESNTSKCAEESVTSNLVSHSKDGFNVNDVAIPLPRKSTNLSSMTMSSGKSKDSNLLFQLQRPIFQPQITQRQHFEHFPSHI
ncbi:hypothetical protein K469DRAFT_692488 [Zopfia rhizophila CBS 207.26]|uniref:Uncharacterized protein n=1 Tax=Zopfia rhizophila CBS 207.26 TaxID=1314779 RepID=A0A6A6DPL8_9PEZI|nr:hypothetical protein K469DRAFT_692488 [Zopfia rhizophila CBS 207.26]